MALEWISLGLWMSIDANQRQAFEAACTDGFAIDVQSLSKYTTLDVQKDRDEYRDEMGMTWSELDAWENPRQASRGNKL
jgi:hypothetical protein